jgi:hypothetical protein
LGGTFKELFLMEKPFVFDRFVHTFSLKGPHDEREVEHVLGHDNPHSRSDLIELKFAYSSKFFGVLFPEL